MLSNCVNSSVSGRVDSRHLKISSPPCCSYLVTVAVVSLDSVTVARSLLRSVVSVGVFHRWATRLSRRICFL